MQPQRLPCGHRTLTSPLRARAGVQCGKGRSPILWLSPRGPPLHPDASAPPSRGRGWSHPLYLGWPMMRSDQWSPTGVDLCQPRRGEHRHCGNGLGQPAGGRRTGCSSPGGMFPDQLRVLNLGGSLARLGAGVSWETGINIYTLLYIK